MQVKGGTALRNLTAGAPDTGPGTEAELLLCCARAQIETTSAERLRAQLQEGIDWDHLLHTALLHGMTPLVYWHLYRTCAEAVPPSAMDQLRRHFEGNVGHSLRLTGELIQILTLLDAHEIAAIPYKGPVLAASIYGNVALRQVNDLDILIRRRDVFRARDLLLSRGYRPKFPLTPAQEQAALRSMYAFGFINDEHGVTVEIHWGLARRHFSFPLDLDALWERLEPVSLAGKTVRHLAPEDLLLVLCLHGAKHCWSSLKWICDVAALVRARPELDWDEVLRRATSQGSVRMLLLGLLLARELLGVDLPREVWLRLEADPRVRVLSARVREQLFRQPGGFSGTVDMWRILLGMRERFRDRVGYYLYLAREATIPTATDRSLLPLPALLFPAYFAARPLRLAGQYGRLLLERCRTGGALPSRGPRRVSREVRGAGRR
jgi:hypothetical protein